MDLRKLRDKASEAFTKGKFARAAELYAEYCEKDPRDIQARLRMGDAWAKAGDRPQAIASYKAAAESFAKEGFLPRAIAASKLILELDPSHTGVQQMLADLYARKSGGAPARKNTLSTPAPAAPSRHAPIELPDEEPPAAPPAAPEPVELDLTRGALPTAGELPPELEVSLEAPKPATEEVVLEVQPAQVADGVELDVTMPSVAPESAPPGLRRRANPSDWQPAPGESGAPSRAADQISGQPAEPASDAASSESAPLFARSPDRNVARNDVAPPSSRIFIPGVPVQASASTQPSAPAVAAATDSPRPTSSDLERALSRFDELSLEDAPSAPMIEEPEAAPAPKLPSFTELELEGDSLLHAVEVAALAGKSQRGEAADDSEEEVFSITAEVGEGARAQDELPKIPLFSDLPPDAFIELFDRCPLRRYGPNERIIAQGSVGDAFYVVCEGSVRVVREDGEGKTRELAQLGDGAFFGEMALLSGAPRSASVDSASDDTQLLEISAPVLAQLSLRYPSVAAALKKFCRQRMLQNVMNQSALFRPFAKGERRTLVEKFRAREVNKGDLILREGQPTDGLYIVLSGEVEVAVQGQTLARLHEGELFGEMSLLKKTPASATVSATRRTSLIRLPRADFDALILSHPQILVLVSELTDDRQRQNEAVLSGSAELGEQGLLLV